MTDDCFDEDTYRELRDECYQTLRENTIEKVGVTPEYKLEQRCNEAVDEHETVGKIDHPKINAGILCLSPTAADALKGFSPSACGYQDSQEYLATLAHYAVKYDILCRIIDERAEADNS